MLASLMKSTVAPLEGNKVRLSVEVDETEFDKDIDAAFRKIAKEVRLPGFRPGKAPRRVLEARLGVGAAREQALRDGIPVYLTRAVKEHEVDIIATPEVNITGGEESGPVQFDATIEVRPTVTVAGYGGLRVEVPSVDVDPADIDGPIDAERRRHGSLVDVDRPAVKGDQVTLTLGATRDGEPVAGLNTEDWLYELGRGWVADTFDDELIGATAGDVLTFSATPSGTEEAADFTVTVTKVQELALPELTDEWVAENVGEYETVADWRKAVAESLEVDDDELEAEYARIALQVNMKASQVRKEYERQDAVASLKAELRNRKALDWLLHRVEIVDPDGKMVERSLLLPSTGDESAETPDSTEEASES